MVTGKFKNNSQFYDGFEPEGEIVLTITEYPEYNIHIWDGYFLDFFGSPALDGKGWKGFTRDYNQMERTFGNDDFVIKDVKEYLDDMLIYSTKEYEDKETSQCFTLLRDFLKYALENHYHILVHVF